MGDDNSVPISVSPDAIGIAAGQVGSFGSLNEGDHQILKQRLDVLDVLQIALAEDATAGDNRYE